MRTWLRKWFESCCTSSTNGFSLQSQWRGLDERSTAVREGSVSHRVGGSDWIELAERSRCCRPDRQLPATRTLKLVRELPDRSRRARPGSSNENSRSFDRLSDSCYLNDCSHTMVNDSSETRWYVFLCGNSRVSFSTITIMYAEKWPSEKKKYEKEE